MQPNPYKAYRLAQSRVTEAHREAERARLAKSVAVRRRSRGWLALLGLRRPSAAPVDHHGATDEARPASRWTLQSTTR